MPVPHINISEYFYDLPDSRIPDLPVEKRDASKLLVYKNGSIKETIFNDLAQQLPSDTLLVFNNSKVFPARLIFEKITGSRIEVFCLQPISKVSSEDNEWSMVWECMVGNLKRWKNSEVLRLEAGELTFKASLIEILQENCLVQFSWKGAENIYEVLEKLADLPLPPYMNRKATLFDKDRYQTVYAKPVGSVAAPTAGLHFTEKVLADLTSKGIEMARLTLHVGAGTFKPVKAEVAAGHHMHAEKFTVSRELILALLGDRMVVPVGTTSLRVLESLYWLGVKLSADPHFSECMVEQWDGFSDSALSKEEALNALLTFLDHSGSNELQGSTKIFIVPGYSFKICKGIITNFHQPGSTLILLVAALLGDRWRGIYDYALAHDFRFLSYGDSSLLFP